MFTQTRANYRYIDLRRFRSLGQIRRFCRDHRLVSQLPKKPTIVNRSRARRSLGRFENILEIQISTPVVNSGGYKNSGQSSDASLVTERYEQRQLTDTSLRQSISDRETRQQVYCTTSVRIGYILINYVVRYIPAFVWINRHLYHLIYLEGEPITFLAIKKISNFSHVFTVLAVLFLSLMIISVAWAPT